MRVDSECWYVPLLPARGSFLSVHAELSLSSSRASTPRLAPCLDKRSVKPPVDAPTSSAAAFGCNPKVSSAFSSFRPPRLTYFNSSGHSFKYVLIERIDVPRLSTDVLRQEPDLPSSVRGARSPASSLLHAPDSRDIKPFLVHAITSSSSIDRIMNKQYSASATNATCATTKHCHRLAVEILSCLFRVWWWYVEGGLFLILRMRAGIRLYVRIGVINAPAPTRPAFLLSCAGRIVLNS